MTTDIELLQFFTCKDLDELLQRASKAFTAIGFPYVILKWNPTPAPETVMGHNSLSVWSNYDQSLGGAGHELTSRVANSVIEGLQNWKENTRQRQDWMAQQSETFLTALEAPQDFSLTQYEQYLLGAFGAPQWTEFIAHPLCRERDRILVLDARTTEPVSEEMVISARKVFSVFETVYRCFHTQALRINSGTPRSPQEEALSRREVECLQWLAAGKTLNEAAIILDISERTLRFHVSNARERLGVATTMQAVVAAALEYGFDPNDTRRSVYAACRSQRQPLNLKAG